MKRQNRSGTDFKSVIRAQPQAQVSEARLPGRARFVWLPSLAVGLLTPSNYLRIGGAKREDEVSTGSGSDRVAVRRT